MHWYFLLSGAALFFFAGLLTWLIRRTVADSPGLDRYRPIPFSSRTLRLIKKAAALQAEKPGIAALHTSARSLTARILHLRDALASSPALSAGENSEPRLMPLAHQTLEAGRFTPDALLEALSRWNQAPAMPSETASFPLCIGAAQVQRLSQVLDGMLRDERERTCAARLERRLMHSKKPSALLMRSGLHSAGMAELLRLLRTREQHQLLTRVEHWVEEQGASAEEIIRMALERQLHFAEELRRAGECLDFLSRLDWLPRCEEADSLHPLLTADPSGVYPRMDAPSRLALRLQVERFSRRARCSPEELLSHAMQLSNEAEPGSLETSVSYWFHDAQGLVALYKAMPTKAGRLSARLSLRRQEIAYGALWLFGAVTGFIFLQARQPVFMLPFFALVTGCVVRAFLKHKFLSKLPGIEITSITDELRTLVILPAVLTDSHEAIRLVRQLKTLRHAFPETGVDFLLLGDFADSMTAVSSADAAIVQAAASAIAALEDARCLYLQRGRTWDSERRICCARGGRRGAVTDVCRLIAQGECEDVITYATVEAARFERHYAYVLALPADRQPAPGMLETLLRPMTHPLCGRYPTPDGWRGYAILSPEGQEDFDGTGLIRPDAYLEATDGMVDAALDADALCGELAGHASVPGARMEKAAPDESWEGQYRKAVRAWRLSPWQLRWVHTPSGLVRNPLGLLSRFRLREQLRQSLVPLGRCALLLWSILTGSWILLLLSLLAPEVSRPPRRKEELLRLICRLSLLPMQAAVSVRGIIDVLRRKKEQSPAFVPLEIWTQGIAATVMTALGIALPQMALPALALGVLFACFPLAHRYGDAPMHSDEGLTEEHTALLTHLAAGTWRFFFEHTTDSTRYLPPCTVQYEPPAGAEDATSPEAIAAYLLACVCARELDLIAADGAAERIGHTLSSLRELSMPFGLPCRRYALPSLTVQDPRVEAAGCGLLLSALMTVAQALRTWLPELSDSHLTLSGEAEEVISSFDLTALYDADSGLFHHSLDENGQGIDHVICFADEALLLSVAACARRMIPPEHFFSLSRACVRLHGREIALSGSGSASAHLLAGLFLPMDEEDAQAFIGAMQSRGNSGLWGQGFSACFSFGPALRYRRAFFGIQEAALSAVRTEPVFSPYAAALCLPFAPHAAGNALLRFHALGASGPLGMCDAVDCTQGQALAGLHDALHQGILLMAAAHVLSDAPVQRYFCALPEVEACLPLLERRSISPVLPAFPVQRSSETVPPPSEWAADSLWEPAEAHLLGTQDFRLLMDSRGSSLLLDGDIPLTRFESPLCGVQFYLADEGRVWRIGDPLYGKMTFAPGEVRVEQLCGSLKAELVCTADTLRRRALHVLTITNLSTRDRVIDAADCLLPDLSVPGSTLEIRRPEQRRLTLSARGADRALHHTLSISVPPLSVSACTETTAFFGRGRTLQAPASLEEPARDHLASAPDPCLSFRVKLALGGRGQATIWFTTSLLETDPPQLSAISGIRRLAAMQHSAINSTVPMDSELLHCARRLLPLLLRAECIYSLLLEETAPLDILSDLALIIDWLLLHGLKACLHVTCPQALVPAAQTLLQGHPAQAQITLNENAASAASALIVRNDQPLSVQLEAMYTRLPHPGLPPEKPRPAMLPRAALDHRSSYGGFEPDSGAYVIELEPGMTTPAPWENVHASRHFREKVDESGFRKPFEEQVWLVQEDGTALSPWSSELPRSIRMEAGMTIWEAWSDKLDIRLCAACMPGHRCAVRVLRLRNAADEPLTLRISVQSALRKDLLDCAPGLIMSRMPEQGRYAFLAGEGWTAARIAVNPLTGLDAPAQADAPDDPRGLIACMSCELRLPPQSSGEAVWLAGYARHAEDAASAMSDALAQGMSTLLRSVRADWAQRRSALTISTPEDTLDLLMNVILPRQALCTQGLSAFPVLLHNDPAAARRLLLQNARHTHSRDAWAELTLLAAAYVKRTKDANILDARLLHRDSTLYDCCADALLTLPLDHQFLPLGSEAAKHCMLYSLAAKALDGVRPHPELAEFSRKLLNAADTYLWADSCYGTPLRLDVQSLACAAYGSNPRTRQAMRTAWTTLYDRPHGLIRCQEASDAPALPGLPENGGMKTLDAALSLHALLLTGHTAEAHELLRALNPIHHTDDPQRMETFRCAPWQLHGGMCASPMEAGRAIPEGGGEAAALLFAIVLQDVFGLCRMGDLIRITPCVPPDWEDYTLTLREGASTWHISVERRVKTLTIDGTEAEGSSFTIQDDGRVHQVRIPLA